MRIDHKASVNIIGAGISGLATGIYLQMNGFRTHIFERHLLPGGCSTAWSRKNYIFDYCIDWLIGSGPNNDAHELWQEVGALDGKKITNFDLFNRVITENGQEIVFYNDHQRLEKHLLELFPNDAPAIKTFCEDLKKFSKLKFFQPLKPKALMSWTEKINEALKILPHFFLLWRTAAKSMDSFVNELKNPELKKAMPYIFFQDPKTFPMLPFLYNMGAAHQKSAGFPEGGSLGLARSMENRYLELGGRITYKAAVKKILVGKNQACGLELKKGQKIPADFVISAADATSVIYDLLDGAFIDPEINHFYQKTLLEKDVLFPSVISVFIGIKKTIGINEPHSTSFLLNENQAKKLPGLSQNCLVLQHRSKYAEGFAPLGHSLIHCTYFSDFDFWQKLRDENKALYRQKKIEISSFITEFLASRYPGIEEHIEILEIATPATTKRYTGNLKGSIFGFKAFSKAEDEAMKIFKKYQMKLPKLNNFYMTGQWILGGGLPRAVLAGRYVAQFLCRDLNLPFKAFKSQNQKSYQASLLGKMPTLDQDA